MTPALTAFEGALRRWAVPAVLLAVAAASAWMLQSLHNRTTQGTHRPLDAPDAYMDTFVTVEMNEIGKPKRRLEADQMVYRADRTVMLTNPHYVLYRTEEREPWHVRSERGQLSPDGNVLLLTGGVDIWRNDGSGARNLDIRTEDLKVLPDSQYGETAGPATISMPASTSTGVGMRAWLDETRIELLSEVRTHVDGRSRTR